MTGRKQEFLEQINKNYNIIRKICNVYCQTGCDKEDLAQDIIYQLWKSYRSFENRSSFSTWMYRVAINTAIGYKGKKTLIVSDDRHNISQSLFHEPGTEELNQMVELLYSAIGKLKPVDKAIIMLWLDRKSYRKISEITGFSEKNISVKLVRIKDLLKELLAGYEFEI